MSKTMARRDVLLTGGATALVVPLSAHAGISHFSKHCDELISLFAEFQAVARKVDTAEQECRAQIDALPIPEQLTKRFAGYRPKNGQHWTFSELETIRDKARRCSGVFENGKAKMVPHELLRNWAVTVMPIALAHRRRKDEIEYETGVIDAYDRCDSITGRLQTLMDRITGTEPRSIDDFAKLALLISILHTDENRTDHKGVNTWLLPKEMEHRATSYLIERLASMGAQAAA